MIVRDIQGDQTGLSDTSILTLRGPDEARMAQINRGSFLNLDVCHSCAANLCSDGILVK